VSSRIEILDLDDLDSSEVNTRDDSSCLCGVENYLFHLDMVMKLTHYARVLVN